MKIEIRQLKNVDTIKLTKLVKIIGVKKILNTDVENAGEGLVEAIIDKYEEAYPVLNDLILCVTNLTKEQFDAMPVGETIALLKEVIAKNNIKAFLQSGS